MAWTVSRRDGTGAGASYMMRAMLHLTILPLLLACGGSPPPPSPEAAAPPKPMADGALGLIPPVGDELVGCPPGTSYVKVDVPEGGAEAWCDRNGTKHGSYLKTWPTGTARERGVYAGGQQDGPWTTTHTDGSVESRGTWDHGRQIGPWTWYWPNGKKKEEGDYVNGRRLGDWVEYGDDGRKLAEGMYRNGQKEGSWTIFQPGSDGVVDHLERWSAGQLVGSTAVAPAPATAPKPR